MILFIKLLIAHFLGDFVFQPESWVNDKEKKKVLSLKLYFHVIVHVGLMIGLTLTPNLIGPILLIGLIHYVIDLCKVSIKTDNNKILAFLIDQLLHVGTILVVLNYFKPFINMDLIKDNHEFILLILLTLILLTSVLSHTIKVLISKWTPQTEDIDEDSLKDAGKYIGILERLFIFGFVITNNIQAVGFLLAAKSVFRFGDLKDAKDRKLTEYILIGTLISFGLSILIGILYLKIASMITDT